MNGKEAIELLGCNRTLLHLLCKRGKIRFARLSSHRYDYSREDIERIINERSVNENKKCDFSIPSRMVEILGFDLDELRSRNKSRLLSDRRRIVSALLIEEGMTQAEIARFMNRKQCAVSMMLSTSYLVEKEIVYARSLWQQHR